VELEDEGDELWVEIQVGCQGETAAEEEAAHPLDCASQGTPLFAAFHTGGSISPPLFIILMGLRKWTIQIDVA
jgi:hypothetical protein